MRIRVGSLIGRERERLVDHDMPLLMEALFCQFVMGIAGGGDDHKLNPNVTQHLIHRARHMGLGVLFLRIVAAALDHRGQLQPGRRLHHGGMKHASRQSESHHRCSYRFLHHQH